LQYYKVYGKIGSTTIEEIKSKHSARTPQMELTRNRVIEVFGGCPKGDYSLRDRIKPEGDFRNKGYLSSYFF